MTSSVPGATHRPVRGDASRDGRPHVCIVSLSDVRRDARVLRQIETLSPECALTVIGYGEPDPSWRGVTWIRVPPGRPPALPGSALRRRASFVLRLALGRVFPSLHAPALEVMLRRGPVYDAIQSVRADLYWANDWGTLPATADAARLHGGKLVFDAHEFAPLEWEQSAVFRWRDAPLIDLVLRRYAAQCDATITVCQPIADRYAREYGFRPIVVRNTPALTVVEPRPRPSGDAIRLIHHGSAVPARRLELMIDAIAAADAGYSLTFMLVGDAAYIAKLRELAERRAPGRVTFVDPVAPAAIPERIAEFDMGLFLLETHIYNYEMALPNKLFDFIMAGLAVCVGPSPAMAELVREHGCGVVAPATSAEAVARTLRGVDRPRLDVMQEASRRARLELNAGREMAKVRELVHALLPGRAV